MKKFFHFLLKKPYDLPRAHKKVLMLLVDLLIMPLALYFAFALRFSEFNQSFISDNLKVYFILTFLAILIFTYFDAYKTVIRFMSFDFVIKVIKAVGVLTLFFYASVSFLHLGIPRSIPIIFAILVAIFVLFSRALVYAYYKKTLSKMKDKIPVAIYGAGGAGVQLASALDRGKEFFVRAFFDDDANLIKNNIHGIEVYPSKKISTIVKKYHLQRLLLAMPSIAEIDRLRIINHLSSLDLGISIDTVPSMPEIVTGLAGIDKLRKVEITDLLGRGEVEAKQDLLSISIKDKNILVTGAGGTIGGELCRQILKLNPKKLVLFELNEFALYSIESQLLEMQKNIPNNEVKIYPILGSITDKKTLDLVFSHFQVNTIYHAAAYKHVPMVEYNIFAGLRNNVLGTKTLAEAAIEHKIERFILISTDKAVRPTNIMGASKRWAELILQDKALSQTTTCFSMVRFGNVLGSSGSVVPLFTKQIQAGGPVTVTHKDIIRYFMTISEAALLVIQAGGMAEGGEVFLLDMGEAVSIYELARKMINLSGLSVKDEENPNGDIEIIFSGLRPGEKLYEELLIGDTNYPTSHKKIMRGLENVKDSDILENNFKKLQEAELQRDYQAVLAILAQVVEGFNHEDAIKDCLTWN